MHCLVFPKAILLHNLHLFQTQGVKDNHNPE